MRRLALAVALAACHATAPASAPTAAVGAAPSDAPPAPRAPGPATVVVALAPHVATAVLVGPFLVTSINPGGGLELAVGATCADPALPWFAYSGGGVAAGAGQTLCARSARGETTRHGFSGHD